MEWNVTMLAMHAAAFVGAVLLYRDAPCWMQKLVVIGLAISQIGMCVAYSAAINGAWWWPLLERVALANEHIAVLLYIFRLLYRRSVQTWNYSQRSHN